MKKLLKSPYLWPLLGVLVASRLLVLLSMLWLAPNVSIAYLNLQQPHSLGVSDLMGRPVVVEARSPDHQPHSLSYTFAGCPSATIEVTGLRQYELRSCPQAEQPRQLTLEVAPKLQVFYAGLAAMGAGQGNLLWLQFAKLDLQSQAAVHTLSLHELKPLERLLHSVYNWDARWYLSIARFGYFYNERLLGAQQYTNAAFYPLLPFLGRGLAFLTGLPPELTLLGMVQVLAVVAGVLLFRLALLMRLQPSAAFASVVLYALFPTSFFLSLPYTESLYITLSLLVFLNLENRWAPLAAALSVLARSTGIVHMPVLLLQTRGDWRQRLQRGLVAGLGLVAFATWLGATVKDPLAFVHAQQAWKEPMRPGNHWQHLLDALLLGPVVRLGNWIQHSPWSWASLNLVVAVLVLVTLFTGYQLIPKPLRLYTLLSLALPYFTFASSRVEMLSFGRFALAAYPLFLVWGQWLSPHPRLLATLVGLAILLLARLSADFGAGAFLG
ncbi:mannosyltransferase family protein [Leptolyngbya sp. FACHB-261]|uniref:mannosyltransferase family protein n=1 Tax=Leptolyngbya sp. FACHB-261 TaxID=2692806 RepID=UPI00168A3ABE|nr:mannosyltransferase family protein [Leptolyngbya sp. FACHB-261]MBD2104814.1 hypothetical protein [Leptolyngbya sp. FACHB-261]